MIGIFTLAHKNNTQVFESNEVYLNDFFISDVPANLVIWQSPFHSGVTLMLNVFFILLALMYALAVNSQLTQIVTCNLRIRLFEMIWSVSFLISHVFTRLPDF